MLHRRSGLLLVIGLLLTDPATAIERVQLQLGDLQGPGWSAQGVVIELELGDDGHGGLSVIAKELRGPDPVGRIHAIKIVCTELRLEPMAVACSAATLRASNPLLGEFTGRLDFRYRLDRKSLHFAVAGLSFGGGAVSLQGDLQDSRWQLALRGSGMQLEQLMQLAQAMGHDWGYQAGGALDLELQARGNAGVIEGISVSGAFADARFNDAAGIHAGEQLDLEVNLDLESVGAAWKIRTTLTGERGQIYIDPVFMEIPAQPVELRLAAQWLPDRQRLRIESLHWWHPGAMDAIADLQLDLAAEPALTGLNVEVRDADLSGLYSTYIKPWFLGAIGGDLSAQGSLNGRFRYDDGAMQMLTLGLDDVAIEDQRGRLSVAGLQGSVDWAADERERRSNLSWTRAGLFRIEIGAARLPLSSRGYHVDLAEAVHIPVLDGELNIEQWHIENPGTSQMRWSFDGLLTPISMRAFTNAMDWPALAGKLSGRIPQASYDQGLLKVGGVLLVRAFDGEVTVRNLELEQPFGIVPRLQADVEIKGLDLKTLTRTFSFGRIEGRLGGYVRALRMEQWRPVSFEARLATPEGDRSRHRISQRALDNISDIGGGGVGGTLSRSFLRFFEAFPYQRLGIGCRLENGVCRMDGVAPAENDGYYIVQGRLIPPRVDVIGYADKVDWHTLIKEVMATTAGDSSLTVQ